MIASDDEPIMLLNQGKTVCVDYFDCVLIHEGKKMIKILVKFVVLSSIHHQKLL